VKDTPESEKEKEKNRESPCSFLLGNGSMAF
jgi:hypothetical protein